MVNINFVPDDYVQNNQSRRTNLIYLVLLLIVMSALGGVFGTIKVREKACQAREQLINTRLAQIEQAIRQFEELQKKKKEMMQTVETTAGLLEPVPRSILLASLTNNLPSGVSLLNVGLMQKEPKKVTRPAPTSKYDAAQAQKTNDPLSRLSTEQRLETHIDISGTAPTDLQVAEYMAQLIKSTLLENVELVESKEHKVDQVAFRQFKLKAMLKKEVHLTREDVDRIRQKGEQSVYRF